MTRRERAKRRRQKLIFNFLRFALTLSVIYFCILSFFTWESPSTPFFFTDSGQFETNGCSAECLPVCTEKPVKTQSNANNEVKESCPMLDAMIEDTYLCADVPLEYDLQRDLYGACLESGLEYAVALGVIEQETRFKNVSGDSGASVGYMQIQEKWHKGRMEKLGVTDLFDPVGNFRVGCDYLAECIGKYGLERGLCCYNSGRPGESRYSIEAMERIEKWRDIVGWR